MLKEILENRLNEKVKYEQKGTKFWIENVNMEDFPKTPALKWLAKSWTNNEVSSSAYIDDKEFSIDVSDDIFDEFKSLLGAYDIDEVFITSKTSEELNEWIQVCLNKNLDFDLKKIYGDNMKDMLKSPEYKLRSKIASRLLR